jgi:flavin reductase (DIM6/NTAB) family NADH-FMN oxidoreductase RutF
MIDGKHPPAGLDETLAVLWSPVLAITTAHAGRSNGMIAATGLAASLVPEGPRVLVELWKSTLTRELVLASGTFALHVLAGGPADALERTLLLVRQLGMHSGRDADKLAGISWTRGVTGAPILQDALTCVEARVVHTLDLEECSVLVADVVHAHRLRAGVPLARAALREHVPKEWMGEWAASRERQVGDARSRRTLSV